MNSDRNDCHDYNGQDGDKDDHGIGSGLDALHAVPVKQSSLGIGSGTSETKLSLSLIRMITMAAMIPTVTQ